MSASSRSEIAAVAVTTDAEHHTGVEPIRTTAGDGRPTRAPRLVRRFASNRLAATAACVLIAIATIAVLAPLIAPYDPNAQDISNALQGPSAAHLLGTDDIGRDLLSRIIFGARLSLGAAAIAVGLGAVLGVLPGLIAGYRQGWFDLVVSRIVDAVMCIPGLVLAIALVAMLGPGILQVAVAVGVSFAPRFYRVTRGAALGVSGETYVKAMRSVGARHRRILLRHVLPNSLPPVIVQGSLMFGFGLLAEAALSFLGMGAQPPDASWGSLLQRGSRFMVDAKYLSIVPGMTIVIAILAVNMFGDGLQDVLGVKKGRGERA